MATFSLKYFDTLEFVKRSKELGASEQLAEYQVRQMEQAIEIAVKDVKDEFKSKDLATKGDLREVELKLQKEMANAKIQTLLWIGLNTAFMLGVIAKGFHWW